MLDDTDWTAEDEAFNWALSKRIGQARRAAGKTQSAVARETGIKYSTICRIETGRARIGLDLLQRLADGIGVSATKLLPRTDQVTPAA